MIDSRDMSFSSTSSPSISLNSNPLANLLRKQSSASNAYIRDVPYSRQSRASIDSILSRPLAFQDTIGFSTLPDQIHRKTLKRGFEFTIMVVGKHEINCCLCF